MQRDGAKCYRATWSVQEMKEVSSSIQCKSNGDFLPSPPVPINAARGVEHVAQEKSIPATPSYPECTNQSKAAFLKNQPCPWTKCPLLLPSSPEPKGNHSHSIPLHPKPSQHRCQCCSSSHTFRAAHPTWAYSAVCHTDRQNPQQQSQIRSGSVCLFVFNF